jgi:hypothetical protein
MKEKNNVVSGNYAPGNEKPFSGEFSPEYSPYFVSKHKSE